MKEGENLCTANEKLLEKIRENTNKCKDIPSLRIWRQYCQGVNINQSDQQIQCNSQEIYNNFFEEIHKSIIRFI